MIIEAVIQSLMMSYRYQIINIESLLMNLISIWLILLMPLICSLVFEIGASDKFVLDLIAQFIILGIKERPSERVRGHDCNELAHLAT